MTKNKSGETARPPLLSTTIVAACVTQLSTVEVEGTSSFWSSRLTWKALDWTAAKWCGPATLNLTHYWLLLEVKMVHKIASFCERGERRLFARTGSSCVCHCVPPFCILSLADACGVGKRDLVGRGWQLRRRPMKATRWMLDGLANQRCRT